MPQLNFVQFVSASFVRPMLDGQGMRLYGSTSGYVGLAPAATAGSVDYTLPSADGTNGYVLQTNGSGTLSWVAQSAGVTDHGALSGLTDDDHTQYALLAGRSGGQTIYGGTGASDILTLYGTSNATLGEVKIGRGLNLNVDEVNDVVATNGGTKLRLYNTGNLGYVGFIPATGSNSIDYTFPNTDGSANQVLQTNGSATLSWATAASSAVNYNHILNGDFDIWQVEDSFAAIANAAKHCDMWTYTKLTSGAVHTVSRSTDVPTVAESDHLSNYSLLVDNTTADASVAAGDLVGVQFRMEGYDYQNLSGQEVTFSFWHKHTKTGVHCVRFSTTDRYYIAEYTQTTTDTWEKATITLTLTSAGTWDSTNGIGLTIFFTLMAGTTYHASKDSWITTDDYATSSVVNDCDSTANNFRLAQLKLEIGDTATQFSKGSFKEELSRCQRYYESTYPYGLYPGDTGRLNAHSKLMYDTWYGYHGAMVYLTEKRATPTATIYNTQDGTANEYSLYDGAGVFSSNVAGGTFSTSTKLTNFSGSGNGTANYSAEFHAVYDARL